MLSRLSSPNDIRAMMDRIENEEANVNRNTHPVSPEQDPRMLDYTGADIPVESAHRNMRHVAKEVEVMLQVTDKLHEVAEHIKLLINASNRHVIVADVEQMTGGSFSSVLRDLRKETLHCIIDGRRACVRYEKVMNDLRRMRRSIRNMGKWRSFGGSDSLNLGDNGSEGGENSIHADGDFSLPVRGFFHTS